MAKHGRNATANPVYSRHEREKDKASEQYGTQKRRAGTDSVQQFDCCNLSSQPAKHPVITPEGYIYDLENILENLVHQKKEIKRKTAEFEAQRKRFIQEQEQDALEKKQKETEEFIRKERSGATGIGNHFVGKKEELSQAGKMLLQEKERIQTEKGKVVKALPSFWIPSLTPASKETEIKAPSKKTLCPMSGKHLKAKDLITVNFTLADRLNTQAMAAREERYVCALTSKVLRNCVPCVVLKPSGHVITEEAFKKIVEPDMINPINSQKLQKSDIVPIKSAGTGFASKGAEVKKRKTAALMCI
eukprot:m.19160 g.19160  ORF g.19160 m.19160 type:complete len:303 (-) comp6499_c0_seq1:118-1026(-)